jgi:hypothetical protein
MPVANNSFVSRSRMSPSKTEKPPDRNPEALEKSAYTIKAIGADRKNAYD